MGITGSLIKVLEHGLSIYDNHASRKYLRELINLKQEYYNEISKPEEIRNNAVIDNIRMRLRILSDAFTILGAPKPRD